MTVMLKSGVVFLFFLLITADVMACGSAAQTRLLPLGGCEEGYVFYELQLRRFEYMEGKNYGLRWKGTGELCVYTAQYKKIKTLSTDTFLLENKTYVQDLQPYFTGALKQCETLGGFVKAQPRYISMCDYQDKCKLVTLKTDTVTYNTSLLYKNREYQVTLLQDTLSMASEYLHYFGHKNSDGIFTYAPLDVSSVRTYKIGDKELLVCYLGLGERLPYDENGNTEPAAEYKPGFKFDRVANSVFAEPLLHHGHGFDFFAITNE